MAKRRPGTTAVELTPAVEVAPLQPLSRLDEDTAERKRLARVILEFFHAVANEVSAQDVVWDPRRLNLVITAIVDELPQMIKDDDRIPIEEKVSLYSMITGVGRGVDNPEVREMFLTQEGFERFWGMSMVAVRSMDRFVRYIALEEAHLSPKEKDERRRAVRNQLDLYGARSKPS